MSSSNSFPHDTPRVVVAHDYFTQRGGAERVALELASQLRAHRIVTSVFRPDQTFDRARGFDVRELKSRLLKPFASDPRRALPFLARAWSTERPVEADAVIASSSGWAHGIPVAEGVRKVVYCHNPARWLHQPDDYTASAGRIARVALGALGPGLRRWDHDAAHTADAYVANSTSVAARIRSAYGIDAEVVHPPVSVDVDGVREPVPGLDAGFFLTVARPRGYKGTALLREAFSRLRGERLVVVGAEATEPVPANVTALGSVSEQQLRWLYANARALVSVSHEDFGLTPVEANAFGTPSLVLRAGGFLDSTAEGVSGSFIEEDTVGAVIDAVTDFEDDFDRDAVRRHAERFSPDAFGARMREIALGDAAGHPSPDNRPTRPCPVAGPRTQGKAPTS
jgi:glycosyltransferase involved in cell wall biosynthesis